VATLSDNPFAILTAIVAPAVLTNACSVLALGTSNRIARVVDRTRVVNAEVAELPAGSPILQDLNRQFERLRVRAQLLLRALRIIYAALGGFSASALISVIGAVITYTASQLVFWVAGGVALAVGIFAVSALVSGCTLMVRETRLALLSLAEEEGVARKRYQARSQPSGPI
jgi:Protein of unknown function (DUF2721)